VAQFIPCQGKTACRDDGVRCLTCGRSLEEVVWLRDLIGQLAELAVEYEYDNVEQYIDYIVRKVEKMIESQRQEQQSSVRAS
jgi:hypothetical protein